MDEVINVGEGKYTLIYDRDAGTMRALRYGEEWMDLTGDNLIFAMFCEIQNSKSRWIPIQDGLPENRVGKLVCCEGGIVDMMYYDPEKKYWVSQMGFERHDIVAWMDKPEVPGGGPV